jgi:8-oxo-dGTP pyrophosphatase MutT (NUDIX family)
MKRIVAEAHPAATVVVLRDGAHGPEVFMIRRHEASPFMPGAHVFPGGRLDDGETAGAAAIRELREETGIALSIDRLIPLARWRTPVGEPRRFDALFFAARMPADQIPVHDPKETTGGEWLAPSEALSRGLRREIVLPPPTWTTLRELEPFADVEAILVWARTRAIAVREPQLVIRGDRRLLVLPGDPLSGEAAAEPPASETRFELNQDRWMPIAQDLER